MIKIENINVEGFATAIRGMRNPMDSWDRSDSYFDESTNTYIIGPKDLELAIRLSTGGPVHSKYKRFITVSMDITAPLYWWKEFDTYKVGTASNSCSTMHRITKYPFTADMFSIEHLTEENKKIFGQVINALNKEREKCSADAEEILSLKHRIEKDNPEMTNKEIIMELRKQNKSHWWQLIQMLPSSFNQRRTVTLNYEVLTNIYKWRSSHKQDEWVYLCEEIKKLPYANELICTKG